MVLHLCSEGGGGTPSQIREWRWYSISFEKIEVAIHLLLGKWKWHHVSHGKVRGALHPAQEGGVSSHKCTWHPHLAYVEVGAGGNISLLRRWRWYSISFGKVEVASHLSWEGEGCKKSHLGRHSSPLKKVGGGTPSQIRS